MMPSAKDILWRILSDPKLRGRYTIRDPAEIMERDMTHHREQ
jgi:hypothetical protein